MSGGACSRRWSASSATSTSPRKPPRRRLPPLPSGGHAIGVPANPGGWLVVTARNRAVDRLRRERTLAAKTHLLELERTHEHTMEEITTFPDERLELVFTCCHPALAVDAQVALTLRTLKSKIGAPVASTSARCSPPFDRLVPLAKVPATGRPAPCRDARATGLLASRIRAPGASVAALDANSKSIPNVNFRPASSRTSAEVLRSSMNSKSEPLRETRRNFRRRRVGWMVVELADDEVRGIGRRADDERRIRHRRPHVGGADSRVP